MKRQLYWSQHLCSDIWVELEIWRAGKSAFPHLACCECKSKYIQVWPKKDRCSSS